MVQVDIFWSYAFGAGFAMSAARQLIEDREKNNGNWFENKYFTHTLLFLAIIFVPSGGSLLWAFPDWETMQVAFDHHSLPAWLVSAFYVTNITQGILGFWVTYHFIVQKRLYAAFFQSWISYFLFFFILVHGWDGTGYQRFFSYTQADFHSWSWANARVWLTCGVAQTLLFWGVFLVPWVGLMCGYWTVDGYNYPGVDAERAKKATLTSVCIGFLKLIFVYGLGTAIAASLLIHGAEKLTGSFALGWIIGVPVFVLLVYLAVLRKKGLFYRFADSMILPAGELT